MKKEIKNLTQEIFRDRELLRYIGFSQQEAEIFYHLIQGESITQIAKTLKASPYHIRKIRNEKFHLIPVLIHRKITLTKELSLTKIYHQLFALDILISESISTFKKFHSIPINELLISRRTINALIAGGIKNTDQLCERSPSELLLFRNIGAKAIKEIKEALKKQCLVLRD